MTDSLTLLWHWDEELRLSFKWDGTPQHDVGVEQGGFGEPTICQISMPERGRGETSFPHILQQFKTVCSEYADKVRAKMQDIPKIQIQVPEHPDFWSDYDIQEATHGV